MFMGQKRRECKGIRLDRELVTSAGQMETLIRGQLSFRGKGTETEEDLVFIHYWRWQRLDPHIHTTVTVCARE